MSEPALLSEWYLGKRTWNALYWGGVVTVDDLRRTDQESLLRLGSFGKVSLAEIVKEAEAHGIRIPKRRWLDGRPPGVLAHEHHPDADPLAERIERLEARIAGLEVLIWGRVAA